MDQKRTSPWAAPAPPLLHRSPRILGRSMRAMIIDTSGVRPAADAVEVGKQVAAGGFFWLDISGGDPSACHAFLIEAGLTAADAAWAARFGQAGRMQERLGGIENNLYEAAGILLQ